MRSQKTPKNRSAISAKYKQSPIWLLLISCCVFLCPNLLVYAETVALADIQSTVTLDPVPNPKQLPRTKVYFYNPEINTARDLALKKAWDGYLHEMGHYELQPVESGESFIKLVQEEQEAAFIMAEWLYDSLSSVSGQDKQNLELALIGVKNGLDTYRKILVANKSTLDFENMTIACSGSKDRTRKIISTIYPELTSQQIENLKILLVPKDIDALLSVGYGLAEMALTTEVGLAKIALLNEHLYKGMLVLRESQPFKRSVLVFKSNNLELKTGLVNTFNNISQHPRGQQAMSLLGLDEWKAVNKQMTNIQESLKNITKKEGGQNSEH
jgi:hypothetical protein